MLNAEQNYQKMTKLVTDQQKMTPTILVTNVILTKKYQKMTILVTDHQEMSPTFLVTNVMLTNVGYDLSENDKAGYWLSDNDKAGYWLSDNEKAGYWGKMILDYEGRGGEVMPKMMDDDCVHY